MVQFGFTQSKSDYSLFTPGSGTTPVVVLLYVDDIILAGPNLSAIADVKCILHSHFKLTALGVLRYFLGLEIAHASSGLVVSQCQYVLQLLSQRQYFSDRLT